MNHTPDQQTRVHPRNSRNSWPVLLLLAFPCSTNVDAAVVSGDAIEVVSNITHPNGNVYDQVLLTGECATLQSDPGQGTRISFVDINDDIVQIEFAGRGRLTIVLIGGAIPSAPATKYNQPNVSYVRGLASLNITSSDATTYVSAFTVGRVTATMAHVIRDDMTYDGIADLALLTIVADPSSPAGSLFGGIQMANVAFSARSGDTGIHAPSVQVQEVVRICDITAFDSAIPKLWFGPDSKFGAVSVAGGDLEQPNGRAIQIHFGSSVGVATIIGPGKPSIVSMAAGQTSAGVILPAQPLRGTFTAPVTGP